MARLIIQSGKHKGKQIVIPAKEIVIGRDEGCFIRLFSSDISRQHCALRTTARGIVVRDLGSSNGTLVNEVPVMGEVLLAPGDHLRVGPAEFEVPAPKPPQPAVKEANLDNDIVEWLTDGDTKLGAAKADDTTIFTASAMKPATDPAKAAAPPAAAHANDSAEGVLTKQPKRPKREFHSVAEEAADIIRRHFESLQSEED